MLIAREEQEYCKFTYYCAIAFPSPQEIFGHKYIFCLLSINRSLFQRFFSNHTEGSPIKYPIIFIRNLILMFSLLSTTWLLPFKPYMTFLCLNHRTRINSFSSTHRSELTEKVGQHSSLGTAFISEDSRTDSQCFTSACWSQPAVAVQQLWTFRPQLSA